MTPTHATTRTLAHLQRPGMAAALVSTFLFLGSVAAVHAQSTPAERLAHAYALEWQGKPAAAIPELQQLLNARLLDDAGTAKAWNILANAYQDQGDFTNAQHAYEQSLRTYDTLPNHPVDRAVALDDFGQLYVATGQFHIADRLETEALRLYQQAGEHAGMARATSHLAGTAFSQGNLARGNKFLRRAAQEAELANNLDDDDRAAIESLKGWQAQLNGNTAVSITSYGRALALAQKRHGEDHPSTGWTYLLLGKAEAAGGQSADALDAMSKGLAILGRTTGRQSRYYLAAEVAYANVLENAGDHAEAAKIRAQAEPSLNALAREQCGGCTVTAEAFR